MSNKFVTVMHPSTAKRHQRGYTLIELVVVLIILAILATIAMKSVKSTTDISRQDETMAKMNELANAIAGNPGAVSGGTRSDFGYIGDVGALPPNWDALVTNPGGYSTWRGPYIQDHFSSGSSNSTFKFDAWGRQFSAPTTNSFSSTGGPSTITRKIGESVSQLLYNRIILSVADLALIPPGTAHKDSVKMLLTFPNGAGSFTTVSKFPDHDGLVQFDSIPIGVQTLQIIFIQQNDTLTRKIAVNPGQKSYADIQYFSKIW